MTQKGSTQPVVIDLAALIKEKRGEILQIASAHGVRNVRVFGIEDRFLAEAKPI